MNSQQLIVGMPNSGKSTYIAALRHVLIAGEVQTELELLALSDNEKHLNGLERKWVNCERVNRTKPATEGWVEFHVRDRQSGAESVLMVPDLRGEAFEQPACTSRCNEDLYNSLAATDGILLFTNADREDDMMMLEDIADIVSAGDARAPLVNPPPFIAEKMPEEVKIVEFLQLANRRPMVARRRRVVLVISAWDIVPEEVAPYDWLVKNRSMLSQFLSANSEFWDLRVYGVSAQGGKLPEQKAELEAIDRPSERIRIVGHDVAKHDLTSPLRWLMSRGI